jgi:hypothetical protein
LHAPLPKRGAGRHRKLRIKGALEGGSGNKPKVGGLNQCKKCHQLGHREAGCTYNGAKKRYTHSVLLYSTYAKYICSELQSYANMCFWDVLVVIGIVGEMRLHGKMEAPPKP